MIRYSAKFYLRVKELRKAAGLTQGELGKKLGCTSAAVSRWERADGMCSEDMLEALAKALGTTTEYLLGGPEPATAQAPGAEPAPVAQTYQAAIDIAKVLYSKQHNVPLDKVEARIGHLV